MDEGIFKYEDCLLKHYIRTEAWLPMCRQRLERVRAVGNPRSRRRLRYFTFCAVGAIDVLMLNVARVLPFSKRQGGFNTVYFFDKDEQYVLDTQHSIPGAIGFPGDFVKTVLFDPVVQPSSRRDTAETRELEKRQAMREKFIESFPFDVINLDLEEFLFKPSDHLPGKMIRAFRKVFEWQKRPLPGDSSESLEGFSLMFTTQIGPPNIGSDYLKMLRERLDINIENDTVLGPLLVQRTGIDDVQILQDADFDSFFMLATPKVLAHTLMDNDWYIDPVPGILVYEFERPSRSGSYKILHMVMDVKRKSPPEDYRAPGVDSREALEAYQRVTRQLFTEKATTVTDDSIDRERLQGNLELIKSRRRKYLLLDG